MVSTLLHTLYIACFIFLALSVVYLLYFSLIGRFRSAIPAPQPAEPTRRIGLLVPAYREDAIIRSTIGNLLSLRYPAALYDIYIIADSFDPATLEDLARLPVKVITVAFEKSTKTKALNEAFRRIETEYDIALILDADNHLAPDFLQRINDAFAAGHRAVQGQRVAKNLDTPFAVLDACSEAVNNNIFRRGANASGLSSSIIGSGMAFEWNLLRRIMKEVHAVAGFDKILQLRLLEEGLNIHYLEGAVVFDEKVASPQAFRIQRRRWVSSQFMYVRRFFLPALRMLLRGKFSYFNLAICGNFVPPRAFLLVLLPLLCAGGWLLSPSWGWAGVGLTVLFIVALLTALPRVLVNRRLFKALVRLPRAVFIMLTTLGHLRKTDKAFFHTVHTKTEVTNTLFNDYGH